jgi:uncharacterized RDD family membrane protein YckC
MDMKPVTLLRRLAAIFYDSLVLFCLIFIAWQPVPLIPDDHWPQWLSQGVRLAYLVLLICLFFGWFWTHGGQTIGMRAWKFRLEDATAGPATAQPVRWSQALTRLFFALVSWAAFGVGFLWSLFDGERRTWHDIASRSRLVMTPR